MGSQANLDVTADSLDRVIGNALAGYPVWIRSVFCQPALDAYGGWLLWQFSENSRVPGIPELVDRNVLRPGETLRSLSKPAAQQAAAADGRGLR